MADSMAVVVNGDTMPEVCVVGAGPAGLMLADVLARLGVDVDIIDERPDQTSAGRADGLQPKSIETLRMLRLANPLLEKGVRIYDICFWNGTASEPLRRTQREVHYPAAVVDLLDDFILLVHQGMVEEMFVEDLRKRGVEVKRSHHFETVEIPGDPNVPLKINVSVGEERDMRSSQARYIVGCDGARSKVRACIPEAHSTGTSHESVWGVLDGELETDFPDIWSKAVIYREGEGSILIIPRERNMTRFYIELKEGGPEGTENLRELGQSHVMQRARKILAPYSVEWRTVEWFGNYQIGQRVATRFTDTSLRAFIAGDASHTHSPKAAQGMNTSMHDSWNLGWKLNLAVRGFAKKEVLLASYEEERRKIGHDLINFDYEHANQIAGGDPKALAENFRTNVRFISGVGVQYDGNVLNKAPVLSSSSLVEAEERPQGGELKEGCLLPPAKATRYIDANPVDVQLDLPILGQFRVYLFVDDVHESKMFLDSFCENVAREESFLSLMARAAAASYKTKPRRASPEEVFVRTERYTSVSELMTFSLITKMEKEKVEISHLPRLLAQSAWAFYLDDVPHLDTRKMTCTAKWVGDLRKGEVAILNVRPDGYVGSISRWDSLVNGEGEKAAQWLQDYYGGFLQIPGSVS